MAGTNTFSEIAGSPYGAGVTVEDGAAHVNVKRNTFTNGDWGVRIAQHPTMMSGNFVIDDNQFTNLHVTGVMLGLEVLVQSLQRNTFSGITSSGSTPAVALQLENDNPPFPYFAGIARARDNQFIGNDVAIQWVGNGSINAVAGVPPTDFGTSADPGHNVFRCNSTVASAQAGFDLLVGVPSDGTAQLLFTGNYWDHIPPTTSTQSTAANGTDIVETSVTPQPVVITDGAMLATVPCPGGRTP
jgi:hypothetical protein